MCNEDKRTAIGISISLSGHLITAALAMIAIEGAYLAFALGNREVSEWFYIFASLTASSFIVSILIAGRGITESRDSGFEGNWDITKSKNKFNWQAILCLLGIILFFLTMFSSINPKKSEINSTIKNLEQQMIHTNNKIEAISNHFNGTVGLLSDINGEMKRMTYEEKWSKSINSQINTIVNRTQTIEENISGLVLEIEKINKLLQDLSNSKDSK